MSDYFYRSCGITREVEFRLTEETEHNGIKVRIFRPILSESEAKVVNERVWDDFYKAMTCDFNETVDQKLNIPRKKRKRRETCREERSI